MSFSQNYVGTGTTISRIETAPAGVRSASISTPSSLLQQGSPDNVTLSKRSF